MTLGTKETVRTNDDGTTRQQHKNYDDEVAIKTKRISDKTHKTTAAIVATNLQENLSQGEKDIVMYSPDVVIGEARLEEIAVVPKLF